MILKEGYWSITEVQKLIQVDISLGKLFILMNLILKKKQCKKKNTINLEQEEDG